MAFKWGQKTPMGGHFTAIIRSDSDFHWSLIPFVLIWIGFATLILVWLFIAYIVPQPRKSLPSEKKYRTLDKDGKLTSLQDLPCWMDRAKEKWVEAQEKNETFDVQKTVEAPEVFLTLVIPAYNEEKRLLGMLEESVNFLEKEYSNLTSQTTPVISSQGKQQQAQANGSAVRQRKANDTTPTLTSPQPKTTTRGWEILLVDDGSKDNTLKVVEHFTRTHLVPAPPPRRNSGPWTPNMHLNSTNSSSVNIPPDSIRLVSLATNRGKGGAVTHGMRHARGSYVLFADADGASDISDLPKLIAAADKVADSDLRAIAVGSRAHMVDTEAVVQRSKLRNFLMHSFHLFLWVMTPPATARIKDTQCGFKLFTRAALPYIVPHMHMEGWIFDVEMLMLAEFAQIPVVEVPIGWKEVVGSKLNVLKDSIGMAWNLALLRLCWGTGIYK